MLESASTRIAEVTVGRGNGASRIANARRGDDACRCRGVAHARSVCAAAPGGRSVARELKTGDRSATGARHAHAGVLVAGAADEVVAGHHNIRNVGADIARTR